ncbi:MAG: hypothetical protein JRJ19_02775 [Deltaproteobacteria bacterium]|nr:hypothetical protein [Deltaproteobacteria bacterium]
MPATEPPSDSFRSLAIAQTILLLVLFVFAFFAVFFPLTNTDIWWHLAAGRLILEQAGFLTVDPFSLSSQGQPWVDIHWLFQVLSFWAHSFGGNTALVIGKCLLFALAAIFMLKAVEANITNQNSFPIRALAVALYVLLIMAGRQLVFVRPIVLSLLFMSVFFFVLERFRKNQRPAILLVLPLTQVLWSNSQPLFPLGPIILLCYIVGDGLAAIASRLSLSGFETGSRGKSLGHLGICLLLCGLACLATPYGTAGLELPFKLFGRIDPWAANIFATQVTENVSPWLLEHYGVEFVAAFKWIAVVALGSFLLKPRRISLARLGLLLAMTLPALMANRNLLIFYWTAGLVILINVARAFDSKPGQAHQKMFYRLAQSPWLTLIVILAMSFPLGAAMRQEGSIDQPSPFRVPEKSVGLLEKSGSGGRLFNSVRYGGYLIWKLHPNQRAYIDGRLVLQAGRQFADYLEVVDHPEKFETFARLHNFSAVVLPVAKPDRYQRLIGYLYRSPEWDLVFSDGSETFFARPSKHSFEPIDLSLRGTVSLLLNISGNYDRAEELLMTIKSNSAQALLARSYYLNKKPMAALALSSGLLQTNPEDVDSLLVMALLAFDTLDYAEAIRWAEQVLEIEPYNAQARQLLNEIVRILGPGRSGRGGSKP